MVNQFQKFKLYLFPSLVSILGLMIWNTVTETRTDIKFLMNQTITDHARIDNLERVVYGNATASLLEGLPSTTPKDAPITKSEVIAMIPDTRKLTRSIAKKK